jgi:hydroxyacylglutathione hydrolase
MAVIALPAFNDNYIWLLVNEQQSTLACVDPGTAQPVLHYAKDHHLMLTHILITHHHADHAGGVAELLKVYPQVKIIGPQDTRLPLISEVARGGDVIQMDSFEFNVLSTPGHTSSHVCYQESKHRWLFCGDTLFSAGCGRVFDGTIEQLHHSIMLLSRLPQDTNVYCGHEYTLQNLKFALTVEPNNPAIQSYFKRLSSDIPHCSLPSTIALERTVNPFMRTHIPEVQAYASTYGVDVLDSLAVFQLLREKKNNFS